MPIGLLLATSTIHWMSRITQGSSYKRTTMGSLVSCLVTETACCAGRAACSCLCKICGSRSSIATRIGYALLFLLTASLSWVLLTDWAGQQLRKISYGYLDLPCPDGQCQGVLGVYRICFTNSFFHMLFALLMMGVQSSKEPRARLQNGFWIPKLLGWVAIGAVSFFIPNEFFIGWGTFVNMPGAFLFILVQVVLLIDFAYTISENLLALWEDTDDRRYLGILVTITFGCYALVIVLTALAYAWFGSSACQLNQFFISFNWILCLFVSILSIIPRVQEENAKSGLSQAAMVSIYATYLIASAISSEPNDDNHCGPPELKGKTETSTVLLGSFFTFLALAYSTSRAATQHQILSTAGDESAPLLGGADGDEDDYEDDEQDGVQYNYSFFHFIFMIGSMYLAMLLTNWDTVSRVDQQYVVGKSITAAWVKVASSWCVLILYAWTLVAPIVLPDRSWE